MGAPPHVLPSFACPHVFSVMAPSRPNHYGCPRSVLPLLQRQRGGSVNEHFNYGYQLVLQASESHLNAGNFKLFWQYERASEWIPVTCALAFRLQHGASVM